MRVCDCFGEMLGWLLDLFPFKSKYKLSDGEGRICLCVLMQQFFFVDFCLITWVSSLCCFALEAEQWTLSQTDKPHKRVTRCSAMISYNVFICFSCHVVHCWSYTSIDSFPCHAIFYLDTFFAVFFLFFLPTCRAVFWKKFWEDIPQNAWLMWAMVVETFVLLVNFEPRCFLRVSLEGFSP